MRRKRKKQGNLNEKGMNISKIRKEKTNERKKNEK